MLVTTQDAILYGLRTSGDLLAQFVSDLDANQLQHRVVPNANAAAWILGHLILSDRQAAKMLGADEDLLPALPDGFEKTYARNEAATQLVEYPDATSLPDLFAGHRKVLLKQVEAAEAETLSRSLPEPMPVASTVEELLLFFPIHLSTHLGQISTIRRSLGMKPII